MRTRRSAFFVGLAGLALAATACGPTQATSTTAPSGTSTAATGTAEGHGKVALLYAGSLVNLVEQHVVPSFDRSTGYNLQGFPGGSTEVANEVKGKIVQGDVFLSASPKADAVLEGAANGSRVSWYATFAVSPLLIAFDPHSRFASQLRSKAWWQVVTEPGFKLGRTDPALDPKGALIVKALDQAALAHNDPALAKLTQGSEEVFPESTLVGRLQAGQLDAGFFYAVEAASIQPHLPTLSISPIQLGATYTITVLRGAPNLSGAVAFVKYLLGPDERAALAAAGLHEVTPTVTGVRSDVPADLRQLLP